MDANATLLIVAGVLAPFLNSLLKQPSWSSKRSWLVSVTTAAGMGGLAEWLSGDFTADELFQGGLMIWGLGQAIYQLIFKRSKLNERLEGALVRESEGGA